MYENLEGSLDFRFLFEGTAAYFGLLKLRNCDSVVALTLVNNNNSDV